MRRKRSINHRSALTRHIPQRSCIACRRVTGKRELIRLVRTGDGDVAVDTSGKKAGRGAYLCRTWECWETGLKGGRLEHALRATLTEVNRQQLVSRREDLLLGVSGDKGK
jgi:predicted RNA-binding protein YlxR (DUF448 family)